MPDRVADSLQRAHQALKTARVNYEAADDRRATINRLYYACFHAARAVLYTKGFDTAKHSGVLSLIDKELVHEGDLPREQSQTLRELFVERQDADYGFGPVTADIDRLIVRAEAFVDAMDALIDEAVDGTDRGESTEEADE